MRKAWSFSVLVAFVASAVLLIACQQETGVKGADTAKSSERGTVTEVVTTGAAEPDPESCEGCHAKENPGIVSHYQGSAHALAGVGCDDCHAAAEGDLDAWEHGGKRIATIVTPRDCGACHDAETAEFEASHHAKAGNILHSLDNLLAEVVEGNRKELEIPHPHQPGVTLKLNGMAFANSGCHQCHGSQVALLMEDGSAVTPWTLAQPAGGGKAVVAFDVSGIDATKIKRGASGQPLIDTKTWPNTGIGRMNLDGSRGSCSACHSRHDFSSRRARQPENCGKCHLGPDHPQKEIYEESKHGIAYRDMKEQLNLNGKTWILGKDYNAAPTCATCHMSATTKQPITHDPRNRISWNNRPAASVHIDTDANGNIVTDPTLITSSWEDKRNAMKDVCSNCHSPGYVTSFYAQYDDFVNLYNAKYANPGLKLMASLKENGLISKPDFDDKIEWTWFFVWHHEGRRARHGTAMMAPDYAHWHGTFEVADRWYNEMMPEARELIERGKADPALKAGAEAAEAVLNEILAAPEHQYVTTGKLPE